MTFVVFSPCQTHVFQIIRDSSSTEVNVVGGSKSSDEFIEVRTRVDRYQFGKGAGTGWGMSNFFLKKI